MDDAVDLEPDEAQATASLDEWRREIATRVRRPARRRRRRGARCSRCEPFHLPRDQFDALVDGVAMDVDAAPLRDVRRSRALLPPRRVGGRPDLRGDLRLSGSRACSIYARDLGVALQLTNILRDVGVDYRNGRLYLPLEDLARFGCTEDDIKQAVADAGADGVRQRPLKALLEHQAARARVFFNRAVRALPAVDARRFVAAEIMRAIYFDLLQRIEAADYDVFSRVIRARGRAGVHRGQDTMG